MEKRASPLGGRASAELDVVHVECDKRYVRKPSEASAQESAGSLRSEYPAASSAKRPYHILDPSFCLFLAACHSSDNQNSTDEEGCKEM